MTEAKQKAQDLFFNSELSQQQIADIVGINRKTLYDWKQQGNWLRAKCVTNQAPMVLVSHYYEQLAALSVDIADRDQAWPTKDEANIVGKLTNTIRTLRRDGKTKADAIEVLANFSELLREKDPELNDKIAEYIEEFLKTTENGWYKDELRRKRQEQRYVKEYREYAENLFEKESNLVRQEAGQAAEAANPGILAWEAKAHEKALTEANERRAAAKADQGPTRDLRDTSSPLERSGEAWGANGVSPANIDLTQQTNTEHFIQNTPDPTTPKNIAYPMGSDTNQPTKQSPTANVVLSLPKNQFHNQKLNRAQRRKLEREAAKSKLKKAA